MNLPSSKKMARASTKPPAPSHTEGSNIGMVPKSKKWSARKGAREGQEYPEAPCHSGTWCGPDDKFCRTRSYRKGSENRRPHVGREVRVRNPPLRGGRLRRIVYLIRKHKLLSRDRSLCIWLQTQLFGTCIQAPYFPVRLAPFFNERNGWLMVARTLPFNLIIPVLKLCSSQPSTICQRIIDRLAENSEMLPCIGNKTQSFGRRIDRPGITPEMVSNMTYLLAQVANCPAATSVQSAMKCT